VNDAEAGDDTIAQIERELTLLVRRAEIAGARRPVTDRLVRSGYLLLSALETDGPLGIAALADATQVDISTASRQIAPLERQGLLRRLRNPADRRGSLIAITELGRRRLQATRDERHTLFLTLLRDWPERDRTAFAEYLARLNRAIVNRERDGSTAP
jgi:DNA-binding MarR family transcriptional regulator